MAAEHPDILLSVEGPLAWATINRVADRNSINSGLMDQFLAVLEEVERSGARALAFTGAGDSHFIGGADGIEMMRLDPPGAVRFSRRFQGMLSRMENSPLILVAAINGLCFGGGFEFALACDLRVAAAAARIGLPEVKVGLIPGGGGTQRLPRLVGEGLAMEMILSGRLYPADKALAMGLVQRAVPDGGLRAGVEELLAPVFKNPAYATSLAKRAVKAGLNATPEEGYRAEAELFGNCHEHDFFRDLMVAQLKSGALTTSEDKDRIIDKGGKS